MHNKKGWQGLRLSKPVKMPGIPRHFVNHSRVKPILDHTIEGFGCDEQAAIYYYCFLGLPINEIAETTGLSQEHVAGVLTLYSERLATKLELFKKAVPYDADDLLPVSEIL